MIRENNNLLYYSELLLAYQIKKRQPFNTKHIF